MDVEAQAHAVAALVEDDEHAKTSAFAVRNT
jgi:hypothetical protein